MSVPCPECKDGKLRQQLNVFVEADMDTNDLSKKGIRKRNVEILGADWPNAYIYCNNCTYVMMIRGRLVDRKKGRKPKRAERKGARE